MSSRLGGGVGGGLQEGGPISHAQGDPVLLRPAQPVGEQPAQVAVQLLRGRAVQLQVYVHVLGDSLR